MDYTCWGFNELVTELEKRDSKNTDLLRNICLGFLANDCEEKATQAAEYSGMTRSDAQGYTGALQLHPHNR